MPYWFIKKSEMLPFSFKNTKISYTESGSGNAIILLHGFLENKKMWHHFTPELSKNNRVITIDLLGHGQSDCVGYVHTMELQAEMVFGLLAVLHIKKASFVGHSMGGYVALAFAEIYPNFINNLVLLNSTAVADSVERKSNRDRAISAVKQNATTFICLSIANLFSEKNRKKLTVEIENTKIDALKTPLQGIIAALEGMKIRKDRSLILKNASFPISLILGLQDPVLSYAESILQIQNTNIKLITFAYGHMSWIENRAELQLIFESEFD